MKTNILITRPSPYGEQLTNHLNRIGKQSWHLPLMTFSSGKNLTLLEKKIKILSKQDLLFIMSQTAIYYAHTWLLKLKIPWPKEIYYYTIGYSTAMQVHKFTGIAPIIYPKIQETSEELLRLPELNKNNLKEKKALIICGKGGRNILQKTLQKRGVQVINCEAYSQIPINYNGEKETQYMIKTGINTILITSKNTLQYLYNLIPHQYKKTWLIKCKLIVISNRIAIHAQKLGWNNIVITKTTNNYDLIKIISKM